MQISTLTGRINGSQRGGGKKRVIEPGKFYCFLENLGLDLQLLQVKILSLNSDLNIEIYVCVFHGN